MTEDQIKHMANRFLAWKLPANFAPDAGISFKAEFNEGTAWPMKHEPSGTNLFDASQAEAMVRYLVKDMPEAEPLASSGTFACPICAKDTPHNHSRAEIVAARLAPPRPETPDQEEVE